MDATQWLARLAAELGVEDAVPDEGATRDLLDLTREVAHGVERVAGPLSTFLLGVAVGRGADLAAAVGAASALLDEPAPRSAPETAN